MSRSLVINDQLTIPAEELRFTFARSSGPGGQNVNKVNTKAQLRWSVVSSTALPVAIQRRFLERFANRVNDSGELLIASERYRERLRNIIDCEEKLRAMILAVVTPPKRRKPTRVTRAAKEARLQSKRRHSQKKQSRHPPSFE